MANSEYDYDSPQVYRLGKTYLANNQGQFYIQNDPIIHMAAGDRHTIIVTETGRAFAFGDNSSGQLGLGHTNNVERVSCIKSLKFGETGEKVILAEKKNHRVLCHKRAFSIPELADSTIRTPI
ncbi:unnamed protein product [Rotaria sordida]|uniref:Uncharacterized protein n=1 Tax=Rotaria sordida TaxID=392033 RepID=A0A820AYL0_9BILA|nr:unnamed protein product [Rotaria sordida]